MEQNLNTSEKNLEGAYHKAYHLACEQLANRDPEDMASNTGSAFDKSNNVLKLKYMSGIYHIYYQDGKIVTPDGDVLKDTVLMTLLLHYLINENGGPITGTHISFREIPGGGAIYDSAYQKRVIKPLIETFGNNSGLLLETAKKFDGKKSNYGDVSVTVNVFHSVPVTYIIWFGDEEFSPSATILFDESISSYLPVEDIVIMAGLATYTLIKEAKQ
ncbi:MAG: DUF3786 domain-containing protein [Candidatus Anammoxibacter sp.]